MSRTLIRYMCTLAGDSLRKLNPSRGSLSLFQQAGQ